MNCRHCKTELNRPRGAARGLCWSCYRTPGVYQQYQRLKPGPKTEDGDEYEPTGDELERVIEEQMRNLPDWWTNDCEYHKTVYTLVKCA